MVFGLGYLLALIYLLYFYFALFHSDSAAYAILASSVVQEGTVLPHHFIYGNQLSLLKNHLGIALAMRFGFSGYMAYAIGSALNFAAFFTIAFAALRSVFALSTSLIIILALAFFFPLGTEEADYILGQQSHLAVCTFALVLASQGFYIVSNANAQKPSLGLRNLFFPLVISGTLLGLLAIEQPARALLIAIPILLTLFWYRVLSKTWVYYLGLSAFIGAGALLNRRFGQTREIVGAHFEVNSLLSAQQNLSTLIGQFPQCYWNWCNWITPISDRFIATPIVIALCVFTTWQLARPKPASQPNAMPLGSFAIFLGRFSLLGLLSGLLLTSFINVETDLRHALWAIELFKLACILLFAQLMTQYVHSIRLGIAGAFLMVALLSAVTPTFIIPQNRQALQARLTEQGNTPLLQKLRELQQAYPWQYLYGIDFWQTIKLEVLAPPLKTTLMYVDGNAIKLIRTLSRSDRACVSESVLYLLDKSANSEEFIQRIKSQGGQLEWTSTGNEVLWSGPLIWDKTQCNP